MSATSTLKKVSVNVKLDDGTTITGAQKTVSISLGTLDKDSFNDDKAMNIVNLLGECLSKDIVQIEKVEVSILRG